MWILKVVFVCTALKYIFFSIIQMSKLINNVRDTIE